jgi:colicin import membrane protein
MRAGRACSLLRSIALALTAWLLVPGAPAWGATAAESRAERQEIKEQRAAIEARFKAGEHECKQRFVVTSCINELQAQRREDLAALRKREIEHDEVQRRAQAEANRQRLERKSAEALDKPPVMPKAASAPGEPASASAVRGRSAHHASESASAPKTAPKATSASASAAKARKRSNADDEAAAAAARVVAQERRASEAAAHLEKVQARNAKREASGKVAAPLPVPAPTSAASQ